MANQPFRQSRLLKETPIPSESDKGRYLSLVDGLDYTKEKAPEAEDSFHQDNLNQLIDEVGLPEEVVATIEQWVEEQIKLGTREFIKRLTIRMAQTLHGFCVLRALGYHAHLEHNGKSVKSLRQIAKHFQCSHQYVDKLTKDLQKQLEIDPAESLEINRKSYSMEIEAPEGFITFGQAIKQFNITRRELKKIIEKNNIEVRNYHRNSKIGAEKAVREAAVTHCRKHQ